MRSIVFILGLGLVVFGTAYGGQMPYPLASTYVAMSHTGDGWSVTATAVGNTRGAYGHTIRMEVDLYNPTGTRSTGSWTSEFTYYSAVEAYLPLCSSGVCEDGTFTANTSWSEEYCPIADAYMDAPWAEGQAPEAPYVFVSQVQWNPTSITRGQTSKFQVTGGKSSGCQASELNLGAGFAAIPLEILYNRAPGQSSQPCKPVDNACFVEWEITINQVNQETGRIEGQGTLDSYTGSGCTIKQDVKSANLTVN